MNLYKIEQDVNNGYDTFDSAVVCADSEESARLIHPDDLTGKDSYEKREDDSDCDWCDWAQFKDIKVTFLGVADTNIKPGVICASFNAS